MLIFYACINLQVFNKITKAYILGPILCTVLNYGFGYKYVYMLVLQLWHSLYIMEISLNSIVLVNQ